MRTTPYPLNNNQKSCYLHLNILANNADNKNLDEIKASPKPPQNK